MDWSRGLFRLWLVASALWVIAALLVTNTFGALGDYVGGRPLRTDIKTSELSVSPPNEKGIVTVTFQDHVYELDTSKSERFSSEARLKLGLMAIKSQINQVAKGKNARLHQAGANIAAGLRFAILPPVFVLALGASLLWALRGFARNRER